MKKVFECLVDEIGDAAESSVAVPTYFRVGMILKFPDGTSWMMPSQFASTLNDSPKVEPAGLNMGFVLDLVAVTLKPELRAPLKS